MLCSVWFTTLGGTIVNISDLQCFCKNHETMISQKLSPSLCYIDKFDKIRFTQISQRANKGLTVECAVDEHCCSTMQRTQVIKKLLTGENCLTV